MYWGFNGFSTYINEVGETSEFITRWPAADSKTLYEIDTIRGAKHFRDPNENIQGMVCVLWKEKKYQDLKNDDWVGAIDIENKKSFKRFMDRNHLYQK